jgi:hypothetical protein
MANQSTTSNLEKIKGDFRLFVFVLWQHLGLPEPTPVQYDIAKYLQHGPKRSMISAFRGVGKSWLTSAYVVWILLNDPNKKIMVVSASKDRSDAFSVFCKRIIAELDFCQHLLPQADQRSSNLSFDVGPAKADHSPSVKSVGISGQLTGSRADIIIADDVEVANNSDTQGARDKLSEQIKEFDAILKPLPTSRTLFLGTPQCEDSLYNKLPERGYEIRVWPAEMPADEVLPKYRDTLAPFIYSMGLKAGEPTDPQRFDAEDLLERKASYGRAGFQLQFQLNTALSDEEKYPLKMRDLIITDLDPEKAPMTWDWQPHPKNRLNDLPNLAMSGDYMHGPAGFNDVHSEYQGIIMAVDPSGRGADETGYAITAHLNGYTYVLRAGGFAGGYDEQTVLNPLAILAKQYKVNKIVVESNFGDGLFTKVFQEVVHRIYQCGIEEVRHSTQKEMRMADTIEPVMNKHRLVFDTKIIEDDYRTIQKYDQEKRLSKSLIYQMSRLTRERGCLRHDDRLDALAMAVAYWVEANAQNAQVGLEALQQERRLEMARDYFSKMPGVDTSSLNNGGTWGGI